MSWNPPPETGMGPGGGYENAEAIIHQEEAQGDESRLAHEAIEARGGTWWERLVGRLRGRAGSEDAPSSSSES